MDIVRPTIVFSCLMSCLLLATRSLAADAADIHTLRLEATDAMTGFYMYQGLDADQKYANRIDQSMSAAYAAASRLIADEDTEINDTTKSALVSYWDTFNSLMDANRKDITTRGYPDVRLVNDMGDACLNLINEASTIEHTDQQSEVARLARALAFRMTDITSQYTGRGTSNLGQVFVGYQPETPKEMAEDFEKLLKDLEKAIPQKDALRVSTIRHKWEFLSRSISNYNENSVPFLVVNYNDSIVDALHQLAASY